MTEDKEVAATLKRLEEQLKDLKTFVSAAENERNLSNRVRDLEAEQKRTAQLQTEDKIKGWQVRLAMLVAVLSLTSSVISPLLIRLGNEPAPLQPSVSPQPQPSPTETPTPSLPGEF